MRARGTLAQGDTVILHFHWLPSPVVPKDLHRNLAAIAVILCQMTVSHERATTRAVDTAGADVLPTRCEGSHFAYGA
jgi:hypothetical protein